MLEAILKVFFHILSWMFLAGAIGCLVVIPIVTYRLFSVLFEADKVGEP